MMFFRNHITQRIFALIVFVAIVPYLFAVQSQSETTSKISSWIQEYIDDDATDLRNKITALQSTEKGTSDFLKEVSLLITQHSEAFSLSIPENSESDEDIYHLLLSEWVEYQQTDNGMGAAAITERGSKFGFQIEKLYRTVTPLFESTRPVSQHYVITRIESLLLTHIHLLPMVGGTAIGAP